MRRHRLHATTLVLLALLALAPTAGTAPSGSAPPAGLAPAAPIVLSGDVTPDVRRLAALVVAAAGQHGVPVERHELEIRVVERIEGDGFVAGRTDGHRIVIGRNVARPELTLLHELAHAVVGPEHGHDEPWRSVYLTAVGEAFGERAAERELRRIEWVYDKSYLDG